MSYLKLVGILLLASFTSGCQTTDMDSIMSPDLGYAIGSAIGAAMLGNTNAAQAAVQTGVSSAITSSMNGGRQAPGNNMQAANGGADTPECRAFWSYANSGACSYQMAGMGGCSFQSIQQKANACNASRARAGTSNPTQISCPSGTIRSEQSCVLAQRTRSTDELAREIRANSKNMDEFNKVNKNLDENASARNASQNAHQEGPITEVWDLKSPGKGPMSAAEASKALTSASSSTSTQPALKSDSSSYEKFNGTMSHPAQLNFENKNKLPTTEAATAPSSPGSSIKKDEPSWVQDWIAGRPIDPNKLSPQNRESYLKRKAQADADARSAAERKRHAEEFFGNQNEAQRNSSGKGTTLNEDVVPPRTPKASKEADTSTTEGKPWYKKWPEYKIPLTATPAIERKTTQNPGVYK